MGPSPFHAGMLTGFIFCRWLHSCKWLYYFKWPWHYLLFHSIYFTSGFYNHPPHDVPRVLRGRRMKQMSQLGLSTPRSINFFDQLRVFVLTATHCKRSFSEEGWKWTSLWLEVKYWESSLKPCTFSGVVVVSLLPGPMASSTAGSYLSRFTVGTWVVSCRVSLNLTRNPLVIHVIFMPLLY